MRIQDGDRRVPGLRVVLVLLVAALLPASWCASAQQVYRWVDAQGRVHYTQQAPARDAAKSVEQRRFAAPAADAVQLPFALQQAMKNHPVTLYTAAACRAGCAEARELLAKRGVPYREVPVSDAPSIEALRAATGDNRVPSVLVGKVTQKGFEPEALNAALDAAGYPRTPAFAGSVPLVPAAAGPGAGAAAAPAKAPGTLQPAAPRAPAGKP